MLRVAMRAWRKGAKVRQKREIAAKKRKEHKKENERKLPEVSAPYGGKGTTL
jgi:hypothetical protein